MYPDQMIPLTPEQAKMKMSMGVRVYDEETVRIAIASAMNSTMGDRGHAEHAWQRFAKEGIRE